MTLTTKEIPRRTVVMALLLAAACFLFSAEAQRLAPFSKLKKKFGRSSGNGNGYIMEQGEDEKINDNFFDWMIKMMVGMGKTPGTIATIVAFSIACLFAASLQDRVGDLEQKMHHRYKRQDSAEGECARKTANADDISVSLDFPIPVIR
jgi:hypothetical protein